MAAQANYDAEKGSGNLALDKLAGAWEVMATSDSEYGSFVDTEVADAGAANVCGSVQAVMDDAAKGYPVAWQR